jgi:hypothetical protein
VRLLRLTVGREGELAVDEVDLHQVAGEQLGAEDALGESILDLPLHGATQRACAQRRIVPDLGEALAGGRRDLDVHVAVEQTILQLLDEEIHDLQQLRLRELREHDRVVDTVEELGLEVLLQLLVDLALHHVVADGRVALDLETDRAARDRGGAEVGRHDDDGVLEVDDAALAVGETTLLEHLQQRVEDVGVRLLDLIEEHDGERLAAHLLGELAALLEADEPGGRTEEARHGVLLAVLGHVERDQRVLVVEQELGERLGELGLADTRGAGEDERARGALRVLEARALAADGLRERGDRLVLADDPLVQGLLHEPQAAGLLLGELEHRDAGRLGEHLGDESLVDLGPGRDIARAPLLLEPQPFGDELLLLIALVRGGLEVLRLDRLLLVGAHDRDLLVELAQLGRARQDRQAQAGAGLVDQVDRLVGQEAILHVAVGEVHGGHDRAVGDRHLVVRLVAIPQPLEDVDRVRQRGLGHLDRLEAALERGVLLEVLAILVERGRADGLQFAAGQHRLQDVGGVDRALRGTGTHERVDLVDEDDDVAAVADLLRHLLQALLEVAAVAAARDHGSQVEHVDLLVLERLGHLALDDGLRQALDDGGLADARLTDQYGVVLRAAREDLHDPLDLLLATDHRIELALAGGLGEVAAEVVEHLRALGLALGLRGSDGRVLLAGLVAGEELDHGLAHAVEVGAQLHEHLRRDPLALADQAEQDVLGADVVVAQLQRLAQAQLEHLLGARGERDVPGRRLLPGADDVGHLGAHGIERDLELLERLRCDALALVDQAEQNVLGTDVIVVEHLRLFLGEHNHPASAVGESLEHQ